jgi:transcriptional regulator with XRE-family HTH domain
MGAVIAVAKRKAKPSGFGRRLRQAREGRDMTLLDLATAVGKPYQNIARLERGEVEPTWPTVLILAAALGVTPDAFTDPPPGD